MTDEVVAQEQRPKVLIVDDYADNREMFAEQLLYSGFEVHEAINGYEALERSVSQAFDVILMDLELPGLDGWEVTRRMRGESRTKSVPIIALTGRSRPDDAKRAMDAGCNVVLLKPCLPEALIASIRKLLDQSNFDAKNRRLSPTKA